MERKRLTAIKTEIKPIVEGKYVRGEGFESNYVITPLGLRISRARILATVMTKFVNEDKTYGFLVLDDGTETIRAKVFKNIKLIDSIKEGDLVDVIGKLREYDGELYIMPEVVKKIENPNFLILRKAELLEQKEELKKIREKVLGFKKQTSDLEEIKKLAQAEGINPELVEAILESEESEIEKEEIDKKSIKEMVLEIIEKLDDGTGAEYGAIISEANLDEAEVEEVINELLTEGTCYEPRPGRIKRL
ncbi:MAG TPA: hypothetical protein ENF95_01100 [Candidatus Aenigmarchaeota archaeon]|nr:hypothetical protein [Candidatus Aenigmarchaeota archaeon]